MARFLRKIYNNKGGAIEEDSKSEIYINSPKLARVNQNV